MKAADDQPGQATSVTATEPTQQGWVMPHWVSVLLVGMPAGGAALMLSAILWFGVPPLIHSLQVNGKGLLPAAVREENAAGKEHHAVVWLADLCIRDAARLHARPPAPSAMEQARDTSFIATDRVDPFADRTTSPQYILEAGRTAQAQDAALRDGPFTSLEPDTEMPVALAPTSPAVERLPGYLDAVLYLSQQIGRARVELAGTVFVQHILMQLFEWTIIATGLFTTVLISVKSLASPKSRGFLTMAVAAVVLSSFGTAVATLNSFYTPRVAYESNRQSLGMLRNLHRSLAGAVLRQNDACNDKGDWAKDWRLRQLRAFNGNFQMIMSTTSVGSAADDDLAPSAPGTNPGSGPQQGPKSQSTQAMR